MAKRAILFVILLSAGAFDQVSKHVCSIARYKRRKRDGYIGVPEGALPCFAWQEERKGRTCKGDQRGARARARVEKPEKFIKRFLSRRRRTSVSDLLAPVQDPACPQEDSPRRVGFDGGATPEFKAPMERRRRISPPFCQISLGTSKPAASEWPSYRPPFNRRMVLLTHPHPPLPPRGSFAGWPALCLHLKTRRNRDNTTCPFGRGSARRRSEKPGKKTRIKRQTALRDERD